MIESILQLIGYESLTDLPYFGEQIILLFILILLFFGALAFLNAILNIIFGLLPGKD